MDENEELDLASLQAQIDMSMSFAQDLVSSWVEPNKVASSSRSHDLEKELKEHMRRPPRLGVGASVQETSTLFSEAARLKGQLRDKGKLKRTEEDLNRSDSDDPDESRAGVIKKKTKTDPFSGRNKKLRNNLSETINASKERVNGGGIKQSHDMTTNAAKAKQVSLQEKDCDTMSTTSGLLASKPLILPSQATAKRRKSSLPNLIVSSPHPRGHPFLI
ncbi:hypothetical protein F5887DRAFT_1195883 [Amanita rubescens]|nr:hypothetical protein F5887DRAFT_1195883 [Amanita rubescens]